MDTPKLVLPIEFPDPEPYPHPDSMVEALSKFEILLLGYYELPDDTDRAEGRRQRETEAMGVLHDLAAAYSKAGAPTEITLHFGPGGEEEREFEDRIAEQTHADAVLMSNPITSFSSVLVAVRDDRFLDSIVDVMNTLNTQTVLESEVLHVVSDEAEKEAGTRLTKDVKDRLIQAGYARPEIHRTVEVDNDPAYIIGQRGRNHDIVVMGESNQTEIEHQIFGPTFDYVSEETNHPVLVVRE